MKKEIIIITDKAHNKPVYELLKKWGFDYNDGKFEEAAEIYYCSPDDDLRYGAEGYLYGDIGDYIKRKIPYTIYLSSDILANPSIVGTFEGAKKSDSKSFLYKINVELLNNNDEVIDKKNIGYEASSKIQAVEFMQRMFDFIADFYSNKVQPPQFQLTRSWIESKKRYFYNSTSSQNAFTYAIEILAKELGLTIKEDK